MSRATAILAKVNKVLGSLGGPYAQVYKRVVSSVGGDPVTKRGAVVSTVDTLLNPQPVFTDGNGDSVVYSTSNGRAIGDVACLVSPTALSRSDALRNDVLLVVKDDNLEEVFSIVDVNTTSLGGTTVVLELLLRSRAR